MTLCKSRPHSSLAWGRHRARSAGDDHPTSRAVEGLRARGSDWPYSRFRCPAQPTGRARFALGYARPIDWHGTRGSPWFDPETGYVDADCSDQVAEIACRRGGPYVSRRFRALAVNDRRAGGSRSRPALSRLSHVRWNRRCPPPIELRIETVAQGSQEFRHPVGVFRSPLGGQR